MPKTIDHFPRCSLQQLSSLKSNSSSHRTIAPTKQITKASNKKGKSAAFSLLENQTQVLMQLLSLINEQFSTMREEKAKRTQKNGEIRNYGSKGQTEVQKSLAKIQYYEEDSKKLKEETDMNASAQKEW